MKPDKLREIVAVEVLTPSEAAAYLGVSRQNLSQQTKAGRIPCIRGKLYLRADLDEYNETVRSEQHRAGGKRERGGREDPPLPSPTV